MSEMETDPFIAVGSPGNYHISVAATEGESVMTAATELRNRIKGWGLMRTGCTPDVGMDILKDGQPELTMRCTHAFMMSVQSAFKAQIAQVTRRAPAAPAPKTPCFRPGRANIW